MRKLSLGNLSLCESNMLSQEEKKKTLGGRFLECGNDGGIEWQQCPKSGECVMDLSECSNNSYPGGGGSGGGGNDWVPCYEGGLPQPSGSCV